MLIRIQARNIIRSSLLVSSECLISWKEIVYFVYFVSFIIYSYLFIGLARWSSWRSWSHVVDRLSSDQRTTRHYPDVQARCCVDRRCVLWLLLLLLCVCHGAFISLIQSTSICVDVYFSVCELVFFFWTIVYCWYMYILPNRVVTYRNVAYRRARERGVRLLIAYRRATNAAPWHMNVLLLRLCIFAVCILTISV